MKRVAVIFGMVVYFLAAGSAAAHFGMVIPSDNMVVQGDDRTVTLTLSFSHPFEGIGMDLARPERFGVAVNGETTDIGPTLAATSVMGRPAWSAAYTVKRPGVYHFIMEPAPYWEPAEDVFIIHYTKTVVAAFGDDEGWDAEVGLKTEIVPLSRPFGLYAGNVFQGIVKLNGRPVPHAVVEVEFYNKDKKAEAPTDYMAAQTVKTDSNGVFTYAAPAAGWWGFAALSEADFKLTSATGEEKSVELGAVIWVKFEEWKEN